MHTARNLHRRTGFSAATGQTTPAPSPPVPGGCADSVNNFPPCLPYISAPPNDLTSELSSQCCDIFNAARCLCFLVRRNSLLGFPPDLSLSDIFLLDSICSVSPTLPPLMAAPRKPSPSGSFDARIPLCPPRPPQLHPPLSTIIINPRPVASTLNDNKLYTSDCSNHPDNAFFMLLMSTILYFIILIRAGSPTLPHPPPPSTLPAGSTKNATEPSTSDHTNNADDSFFPVLVCGILYHIISHQNIAEVALSRSSKDRVEAPVTDEQTRVTPERNLNQDHASLLQDIDNLPNQSIGSTSTNPNPAPSSPSNLNPPSPNYFDPPSPDYVRSIPDSPPPSPLPSAPPSPPPARPLIPYGVWDKLPDWLPSEARARHMFLEELLDHV